MVTLEERIAELERKVAGLQKRTINATELERKVADLKKQSINDDNLREVLKEISNLLEHDVGINTALLNKKIKELTFKPE